MWGYKTGKSTRSTFCLKRARVPVLRYNPVAHATGIDVSPTGLRTFANEPFKISAL